MATGKIIQADQVVGIDAKPNLITNPFGFLNTQGWDGRTYTAAARPSGTPTAGASLLTISSVSGGLSTAPTKLRLSKAVGNAQGQAREFIMDVPEGYQTDMLAIELLYKVTDTDFVAGSSSVDSSLIVYTAQSADGVTYSMTEPQGGFKLTSRGIPDRYKGWVQMNSDTTKLKLILYVADTTNAAWDLDIEACVSPSEYVAGTIITDWKDGVGYSHSITNATLTVKERFVGNTVQIKAKLAFTGASTAGQDIIITTPYTFDTSKAVANASGSYPIGFMDFLDTGTGSYYGFKVISVGTNTLIAFTQGQNSSTLVANNILTTSNMPVAPGTSDTLIFEVAYPVAGRSAGAQMSDGYDGRVVDFVSYKPSNESVTANVTNVAYTSLKDSTASWNGTQFKVPSFGDYRITFSGAVVSGSAEPIVYVNGTLTKYLAQIGTTTSSSSVIIPDLKSGDLVSIRMSASVTLYGVGATSSHYLNIEKLSGSAFMSPLPETMMLATLADGTLTKADSTTPCFTKTGAQTISIKAKTGIMVDKSPIYFHTDTAVVMPTLTTGTDYAIYVCKDGTVRADANFTAPTGYTTTNSKQAGGFHYGAVSPTETVAGGSFATTGNGMIWTQGDVDKLKGINQFSIWDLKFRPACSDPRGMTLVANRFWVDIYFCNTNPEVNGTSKYNSDVASGTVLPKKPTMFGGNGTATYANLNGWTANELARAFGKRFMKESEFVVATFGVTEDQSLGGAASTITNAIRQAGYTSKWGLEQATGHHWTWGEDTSIRPTYAADAWGWQDVNGDRGQRYLINSLGESRILLGGVRADAALSGSRAADWSNYPWSSHWSIGLRAACDHLQIP